MSVGSGISLRQSLQYWIHRSLGSIEHEQRVARIAGSLFDLTRPRHGLRDEYRQLLVLGALVHDVGRCVEARDHEKHGARMVLRAGELPLSRRLRGQLAFLTRYHKGPPPKRGKESFLRTDDDFGAMRLVLALLRAADAMDSRTMEPPDLVFTLHGRDLRIICHEASAGPRRIKASRQRKKFRLLEELLGCRAQVDVRHGQKLPLVA